MFGDLESTAKYNGRKKSRIRGDQSIILRINGHHHHLYIYSKTCVKRPLAKRQKTGFQDQLPLNAGQKYCRMLEGEHSAILWTFIKKSVCR